MDNRYKRRICSEATWYEFVSNGSNTSGLYQIQGEAVRRVFFERAEGLCGSLLNQIHDSLLKTAQAREEVAPGTAEKILEQITATGGKKVLELLVNAATNKEIGEKLGISLRTVKTHTGNIYGKLGLKNRAQCAKVVRELGIF